MHDPSNRRAARSAWLFAASAAALAGSPAPAQNQWVIDLAYSDPAGVINSPDDTVTVTLWGAFDPQWYAFGSGLLDISAVDPNGAGEWSDAACLLPYKPDPGTIEGQAVRGIHSAQIHFPEAGLFANPSNPIAVWRATWRTTDIGAREVPVFSATEWYRVYIDEIGTAKDFVDQLTEGQSTIVVVPAPAGAAALIILSVGQRRRG